MGNDREYLTGRRASIEAGYPYATFQRMLDSDEVPGARRPQKPGEPWRVPASAVAKLRQTAEDLKLTTHARRLVDHDAVQRQLAMNKAAHDAVLDAHAAMTAAVEGYKRHGEPPGTLWEDRAYKAALAQYRTALGAVDRADLLAQVLDEQLAETARLMRDADRAQPGRARLRN